MATGRRDEHLARLRELSALRRERSLTQEEWLEVARHYRAVGDHGRADKAAEAAGRVEQEAQEPRQLVEAEQADRPEPAAVEARKLRERGSPPEPPSSGPVGNYLRALGLTLAGIVGLFVLMALLIAPFFRLSDKGSKAQPAQPFTAPTVTLPSAVASTPSPPRPATPSTVPTTPGRMTINGSKPSRQQPSGGADSGSSYGPCPRGGNHVPGKRDKNGRLHCAKCGQFM